MHKTRFTFTNGEIPTLNEFAKSTEKAKPNMMHGKRFREFFCPSCFKKKIEMIFKD
jgi:hypothetical protein